MKIRTFLFVAFVLLCGVSARAQQDSAARFVRYGVFGSAGVNFHRPDFIEPSQVSRSPGLLVVYNYEPANSFGWSAGGLVEFPIADILGLSIRASLSQVGVTLTAKGIRSNWGPDFANLELPSLRYYTIEPYVSIRPFDGLCLYLGTQFGVINDKRAKSTWVLGTESTWDFQFTNLTDLLIGLSGGIGYELPLDQKKHWLCTFEIFCTQSLSSLVHDVVTFTYKPRDIFTQGSWALTTLRAGVSLRYAPFADGK